MNSCGLLLGDAVDTASPGSHVENLHGYQGLVSLIVRQAFLLSHR